PGVIGAIGTLLGQRNINIASMQVGRDRPRGDAVMILSVDDPVPESIQAEIRRIPRMAHVLTVTLYPRPWRRSGRSRPLDTTRNRSTTRAWSRRPTTPPRRGDT